MALDYETAKNNMRRDNIMVQAISKRGLKFKRPSMFMSGLHLRKGAAPDELKGTKRSSTTELLQTLSNLYTNPSRAVPLKALDRLMA